MINKNLAWEKKSFIATQILLMLASDIWDIGTVFHKCLKIFHILNIEVFHSYASLNFTSTYKYKTQPVFQPPSKYMIFLHPMLLVSILGLTSSSLQSSKSYSAQKTLHMKIYSTCFHSCSYNWESLNKQRDASTFLFVFKCFVRHT